MYIYIYVYNFKKIVNTSIESQHIIGKRSGALNLENHSYKGEGYIMVFGLINRPLLRNLSNKNVIRKRETESGFAWKLGGSILDFESA
jgi:hypothetical protein